MNNDAPQTLDAAGSRVAELEQQLRLSDEGVSRLAQRCLELEQQVLKYEAVLASQCADTEQGALLLRRADPRSVGCVRVARGGQSPASGPR